MIEGIDLHGLNKEVIEMYDLTKNVIVLFSNPDLKIQFFNGFLKNVAGAGIIVNYLPTTILRVNNEQRFIFTVEAPFILQCTDPYDLWFCEWGEQGKIQLYSFIEYKGYQDIWENGVEGVYKHFINGRIGCYEGYKV